MDILLYNELNTSRVQKQYEKIIDMIKKDDFYSAEVKKLTGTPYYRAKLDYTNRLLFQVVTYFGKKYALILEVIHQHAYDKSRFLKGMKIDEAKIELIENTYFEKSDQDVQAMHYINQQNPNFHILDKLISFDPLQDEIFYLRPPLIMIGSAGSGKTTLTLEKMKAYAGDVLYVTGSSFLVQNAHQLYYANDYDNDAQEIDFLSYRELLETIKVPSGKEIDLPTFSAWLYQKTSHPLFQDANKLYEEFKGVITGNLIDRPYLTRDDYLSLGVKQSIYSVNERLPVYELFEKYVVFLKEQHFYDSNIVSFEYLAHCQAKYDFVVVDEVQDFTPVQLLLILKLLKSPQQFLLCGDANQIVHPNFFSWARIKSLFYGLASDYESHLMRILNKNYRNTKEVTAIANKILKAKNSRFGSIDKESHYLVESQSNVQGEVYCLLDSQQVRDEINAKTAKSTRFAVIVLHDEHKARARAYFKTPLIFSIYEAKGLEYDNVILYHFISSEEDKFREIVRGVLPADLEGELTYARIKDKTDRSLEIYKFYVNALYVAVTRAMKNVFFVENIKQHPLLNLFNLEPTPEFVPIKNQTSSREEWQQEARRLASLGKYAQADAISETILQIKTVPWQILDRDALPAMCEKAFSQDKKNKDARLLLFEYSLVYHQAHLMQALAEVSFLPALKPEKGFDLLERNYYVGYTSAITTAVMNQVKLYGVNFRNKFNQTPIMLASFFGNEVLAEQLIKKGANPNLTDNVGRNAFQLILERAVLNKKIAQNQLAVLYKMLLPESMSVQVDDKLIKLDVQQMEYFIVNVMLGLIRRHTKKQDLSWQFKANDVLATLKHFPDSLMPEKNKRRAYIASLLSKHEVTRIGPANQKLFLRIKVGCYILNPHLMLKVHEAWVNVYSLLGLEEVGKKYELRRLQLLGKTIEGSDGGYTIR